MKLLILSLLFILTGCFNNSVKYYKKNIPLIDPLKPKIIATSNFSKIVSTNKPKTYADLPEKALSSLIKSYSSTDKLRSELLTLLAKPIKANKNKPVDNSRVKFTRKFTFSLIDSDFNPANRIYSAHYKLELPDSLEFSNWRDFKIDDRTLDIAKVTNKQTKSLDFTALYTPTHFPKFGETTSLFKNASENTTERNLKFELIETMPIFTANSLEIYLRAPFPQVNLAGSYQFTVDIKYKNNTRSQEILKFDLSKKEAIVKSRLAKYIPYADHNDVDIVTSNESLKPIVRSVYNRKGKRSLLEDDDKVKYEPMSATLNPSNSIIIAKQDIEMFVNQLYWGSEPIFFSSDVKNLNKAFSKPLVLSNGSESLKLKKWLQDTPSNLDYTNKAGENWGFYRCDMSGQLHRLIRQTNTQIKKNMVSKLKKVSSNTPGIPDFCK
jgi:hypothetical protein